MFVLCYVIMQYITLYVLNISDNGKFCLTVLINNSAPIVTLALGPLHKGSSREERGRYVADPRVLNDL